MAVADGAQVGHGYANKVIKQICEEDWLDHLDDVGQFCHQGIGVFTFTYEDECFLLFLYYDDDTRTLQNYADELFLATDEKHLKGADLFNREGFASPLAGFIDPRVVDSDFQN
eukprot:8725074-Ditylum_brightwellii.AAC.1